MCNCIEEIRQNLQDVVGLKDVSFEGTAFIESGNTMKFYTVQPFSHKTGETKSGKEKREKSFIKHKYCPFCGQEYDKEENKNEERK